MNELDKTEKEKTKDLICEILERIIVKIHREECHNRRINIYSNLAAGLITFALDHEVNTLDAKRFLEQIDEVVKKSRGYPK